MCVEGGRKTLNLGIEQPVYDAMLGTARKAAPLEACGICGGTDGVVTRFYELTNADASAEHYRMLPEEQFAAVRNMRAEGVRMLAIWHSHPATPARMSEEDLRLAYTPDTVYMVLSLADAAGPDLRGYVLEDGRPVRVDVVIRPSLPDTRNGIPSHGGAPT